MPVEIPRLILEVDVTPNESNILENRTWSMKFLAWEKYNLKFWYVDIMKFLVQ
jgi:hypothetical protein